MSLRLENIERALNACPAAVALRIKVLEVDAEAARAVFEMALTDISRRAAEANQFHGGAIASFVDTAGDYAIALQAGGGVPTINFRIDYLRPAFGSLLRAEAIARRIGRTISVADVNVTDENDKLCAIGRCTYLSQPG